MSRFGPVSAENRALIERHHKFAFSFSPSASLMSWKDVCALLDAAREEGRLSAQPVGVGELVEAVTEFMPTGLALDNANIPDSQVVPLDVTLGEMRKIASALSNLKAKGGVDA